MKASSAVHSIDSRPLPISSGTTWPSAAADDSDVLLLNRVARKMSSAAPLHEVLEDVLECVTTVVNCDSCMLYVLEREALETRVSKNAHAGAVDRLKMKAGQGSGWDPQQKEPLAISRGAANDPRFQLFNDLAGDRFEAFLSVPLVSGGRLVGVINVQNRAEHSWSRREIGLIATLGFLVGAAIERTRLESQNLQLSDQLETRKVVERAKGILQCNLSVSEEEAYLMLQRESRQRRKPMKDVAEAVILNEELMKKR